MQEKSVPPIEWCQIDLLIIGQPGILCVQFFTIISSFGMLRREIDEEEKREGRGGQRGFESPMDLDSSPLLWFNSAVPPTREEPSPDRIIAMSATPSNDSSNSDFLIIV